MAFHQGFNFAPLLKGGLAAGAGALLGNQAGLSPLQGAGLGLLGGSALGGNSASQRLALGLGPIALAQNAADKRLDSIPGSFGTPFSTVDQGVATIDPSIRAGQQDLLTGLQGNENRFIQARVRPFERQAARQKANIEQGLQRRGLGGSSLATNELARFEGQINPLISDQTALATNESLQAQNQLLNQRFNQELAALGLGAQDIQLLSEQAQLKTDLLGRTIDATGRILAPGTNNISGGGTGGGAPQQGGGFLNDLVDQGSGFLGGAIDQGAGFLEGLFNGGGAEAGIPALGIGLGSIPGAGAGLDIGSSLGFGAGSIGSIGAANPANGLAAFTQAPGGAGSFAPPSGSFFNTPSDFGGTTIGINGGQPPAGGLFSGASGAAFAGGGLAGLTALLRGQGVQQAIAQGGGAAAGAAAGFAVGGPPGAIIGGMLGSLGGGKLGEKLGLSARGGGENKADYSLITGSDSRNYAQGLSSSGPFGSIGFGNVKHIKNSAGFQAGLDAITETDKVISSQLTPEENAAVKAKLGAGSTVGRNSNEGGFSPARMMTQYFDNRAQVLQETLGPQRFAELGLDQVYQALSSGDPQKINQAFG